MNKLIVIISLLLSNGVMSAPKEIKDQSEVDWRDGRYAKVKFGPFVSGNIATPKGGTHKGIAIRLGDKPLDNQHFLNLRTNGWIQRKDIASHS